MRQKCEIIRYRVLKEPFGESRACVRCATHGWDTYEDGDYQIGRDGDGNEVCPAGRREAFERGPLAAAVKETKGMRGASWEDYLKQCEMQADREASQLERLAMEVAKTKDEVHELGAKLERLMLMATQLTKDRT